MPWGQTSKNWWKKGKNNVIIVYYPNKVARVGGLKRVKLIFAQ